MCVSGGKKFLFFGKFGWLCFLVTFILRFALLSYYRRNYTQKGFGSGNIINHLLLPNQFTCVNSWHTSGQFHFHRRWRPTEDNRSTFSYQILRYIPAVNYLWVLLNRAPTFTQLHPPPPSSFQPPPSSIHLHPAYFSLHPALCNTLNNIWTKRLHVIGQFPQI